MELFSFEDMFEPSESSSDVNVVPSEETPSVFAVPIPDMERLSLEEMQDLVRLNITGLMVQEALLNSLADLLIKHGIINEKDLQKQFETILRMVSDQHKE